MTDEQRAEVSAELEQAVLFVQLLKYFRFNHLTGPLRNVSAQFAVLALYVVHAVPNGAERTAGLRKLLEAKDCAVRAALEIQE